MKNTILFKVGDKVLINNTREEGIIKEVVSVLGRGNNTYLVSVDNKDRMYMEDNLSLVREKLNIDLVNVDDISALIEIEDKIDEIVRKLNLSFDNDYDNRLLNAVKVQAYLTTLKESKSFEKTVTSNVVLEDLYNGFVNNKADYVTYSYMFSELLKRVGMNVLNVGAKDENGDFYVTNLVLLDNDYYYFDVNLERDIYEDSDDELILCCAGIGSERYNRFFQPLCILNYNNTGKEEVLPKNIAKEDLDIEYVNSLI